MLAVVATLSTTGAIAATVIDANVPSALASLQPGQWALHSRDGSAPPRTLCLGDPRVLLQVRHSGSSCSKVVLSNNPNATVVNYTCAGGNSGRTEVRVETPRVVQIESQGIEGNSPFEWSYEGRRIGECAIPGPTAQR